MSRAIPGHDSDMERLAALVVKAMIIFIRYEKIVYRSILKY